MLADLGLPAVDGVLFDLGVSSMQLDVRERGFAYAEDAPLDMRMDGTAGITAADVLNTYAAADLTRVLRDYGEEKFARKIAARGRAASASSEPFTTSGRLVELLYAEIPAPARRTGGHPAKRTFQALRMEVNDELAVLRRAIPAVDRRDRRRRPRRRGVLPLARGPAGQAGVRRRDPQRRPVDLPFVPEGHEPALRLVTRGAEKAERGRDRREPPSRLGAAARRRARPRPADRGMQPMSSR